MTQSGLTLSLFVAVTISGCASGPATYEWVNEIDPKAYYKRDYYDCNEEAKSAETLPGANAAGAVALAIKIARHRSDCLAARGWKLIPISGNVTSLAAPEANASPVELHRPRRIARPTLMASLWVRRLFVLFDYHLVSISSRFEALEW